jgi:hypothetical protein
MKNPRSHMFERGRPGGSLLPTVPGPQYPMTGEGGATKAPRHHAGEKCGRPHIEYATEIKVDAMTLMGEFLKAAEKNQGTPGPGRGKVGAKAGHKTEPAFSAPTLSSAGISKRESSDAQALSTIKEKAPELHEQIRTGRTTISKARIELKREEKRADLETKAATAPARYFLFPFPCDPVRPSPFPLPLGRAGFAAGASSPAAPPPPVNASHVTPRAAARSTTADHPGSRSPASHWLMPFCERPVRSASCACVRPAAVRSSRSRSPNALPIATLKKSQVRLTGRIAFEILNPVVSPSEPARFGATKMASRGWRLDRPEEPPVEEVQVCIITRPVRSSKPGRRDASSAGARTFRVLCLPTAAAAGRLRVTIDGAPAIYAFDLLRGEVPGGCCLSLHKLGERDAYHVAIAPDGSASCDCFGALRWGKCKHKELAPVLVCRLATLFA